MLGEHIKNFLINGGKSKKFQLMVLSNGFYFQEA